MYEILLGVLVGASYAFALLVLQKLIPVLTQQRHELRVRVRELELEREQLVQRIGELQGVTTGAREPVPSEWTDPLTGYTHLSDGTVLDPNGQKVDLVNFPEVPLAGSDVADRIQARVDRWSAYPEEPTLPDPPGVEPLEK